MSPRLPTLKSEAESSRLANRYRLTQRLRTAGPTARIDLGAATGLSPATVSAITAEMLRDGQLVELKGGAAENGSSGRGRPKILVDLDPLAGFVLAVKLSINDVQLMVGDYRGQIARLTHVALNTLALSGQQLIDILIGHIEKLRQEEEGKYRRLLGIGIAAQGLVAEGRLIWSPAVSARNVDLAGALAERFHCAVSVENDANCIALALKSQAAFRAYDDIAVIMLGYGIGMGLILGGALYKGRSGAAAEFGHTKFQPDGPMCQCGKRGCVETYISDYALYRDARLTLDVPDGDAAHPSEEQMAWLSTAAAGGNPVALGLFEQAGRVLGHGIANVIAMLAPQKVLISGAGVRAFSFMEPAMRQSLEHSLVDELVKGSEVEAVPWDKDMTGLGIIAQLLDLAERPGA